MGLFGRPSTSDSGDNIQKAHSLSGERELEELRSRTLKAEESARIERQEAEKSRKVMDFTRKVLSHVKSFG